MRFRYSPQTDFLSCYTGLPQWQEILDALRWFLPQQRHQNLLGLEHQLLLLRHEGS